MSAQSVEPGIDVRDTTEARASASRSATATPRVVRVGLLGYGQVGQAVARVADQRRDRLLTAGLDVRCISALVRDPSKARSGPPVRISTDAAGVIGADVDLIVEVLGGVDPARQLVASALDAGIPVVTANKTLVAAAGAELRSIASRRRTAFAFDASVLAGVPCLGSIARRPLVAEAREIAGVLNGTSNFILSEMAQGASFEVALAEATTRGYAEPDSHADVSGLDAAQKLAVLLQLAGCGSVLADSFPRASLIGLDPRDLAAARRLGGAIKPIALAALDEERGGAWVGPAFVEAEHPLSRINGVTNALQLTGSGGQAVLFAGPGAGPDVTAATILDDIAEIFAGGLWSSSAARHVPPRSVSGLGEPPVGPWFIRVAGLTDGSRGTREIAGHVAEFFTSRGAPVLHLIAGDGHLAGLTAPADWTTIREASGALRSLGADTLALPVLEGGARE